MNAKNSF